MATTHSLTLADACDIAARRIASLRAAIAYGAGDAATASLADAWARLYAAEADLDGATAADFRAALADADGGQAAALATIAGASATAGAFGDGEARRDYIAEASAVAFAAGLAEARSLASERSGWLRHNSRFGAASDAAAAWAKLGDAEAHLSIDDCLAALTDAAAWRTDASRRSGSRIPNALANYYAYASAERLAYAVAAIAMASNFAGLANEAEAMARSFRYARASVASEAY